jgi:hypothetical protein
MTTYRVTARRWELGWELHIDGIGVTQAATLASAGHMIRDYVTALTGTDPDEIGPTGGTCSGSNTSWVGASTIHPDHPTSRKSSTSCGSSARSVALPCR